jgi:S-formylglutathione hydrolase FrmB
VALMLAGPEAGDGSYKKLTDAFQAAVQGPTTVSTATVPEGGHNFQTWLTLMPPTMQWLSDHLKVS